MKSSFILIILLALFLRINNIGFPPFTADEARIALRGYTLSTAGVDELGRKFPLIFNSLSDYQHPLTSYITAIGIKLFGKSDFGARSPFIIIGILSVWLVYLIASVFNPSEKFRLLAALIAAFSPTLIFISKFPNETIIVTFLLLLLFYILTRQKLNLPLTILIFVLLLSTSKIALFLLLPFTIFTLLFIRRTVIKRDLSGKNKWIIGICLLLTISAALLFLKIPQAARSLNENNFPIFYDITIKNGIDRLRGQGIEEGWPPLLGRILFNKLAYLYAGFLNLLSHLQPSTFFSQFDSTGRMGLVGVGAWSKILVIPIIVAMIYIIRRGDVKSILLIGFIVILTFPLFFVYPLKSPETVALILPFMAIFIARGFIVFKKYMSFLILVFMTLDVFVNFTLVDPQIKNTNLLRPGWIENVVEDVYNLSKKGKIALSDDMVDDVVPFIGWYTPASLAKIPVTDFPYKFRLNQLPGIKLIGFDNNFLICGLYEDVVLILSKRDLNRIEQVFDVVIEQTYQDSLNEVKAYRLGSRVYIQ